MEKEHIGWKVLMMIVALVTVFVPAWVAYDIWGKGTNPEKNIEISQAITINPLYDLSSLGRRASLSVFIDKKKLKNFSIYSSAIKNVGKVPIVPSDFITPLSVTVGKPWAIVSIEGSKNAKVQLNWKRISDSKFEAAPTLLNPGDAIAVRIYLTNTTEIDISDKVIGNPPIEWNARVVNMQGFSSPINPYEKIANKNLWIIVELDGWALPFTLVVFILLQAVHLHFILKIRFLNEQRWRMVAMSLISGLLSICSAECMSTYIFGSLLVMTLGGPNNLLNAPPILINIMVMYFLCRWANSDGISQSGLSSPSIVTSA